MPYLNIDLDYFEHPKTRRLVGILGRGAEMLPIKLWAFCGKFHYASGEMDGYSAGEIEAIAGWWGQEGQMIEAMVKVGFLDVDSTGEIYRMHNWEDHQGHIVSLKRRAKDAAQKRWGRIKNASSNATGNAPSIPSSNAPSNAPFHSIPFQSNPTVVGESKSQPSEPAAPEAAPAPGEEPSKLRTPKARELKPADDQAWIATLKASPAYAGLDIDKELSKCLIYFSDRNRTVSRKRFLNWLNRAERPMNGIRPQTSNDKRNLGIEDYGKMFSACHDQD